uniref:Uncharacterized protein n=1 Tax=viral metagenome TaxID=1070528 RepID=A0A6C0CJT7_9ZZZZ
MGGSQTKQAAPAAPSFVAPDIAKGQFTGEYLSSLAQKNAEIAQKAIDDANKAAEEAASKLWRTQAYVYTALSIVVIIILIVLGLIFYDIYARNNGLRTYILPGGTQKFTNLDGTSSKEGFAEFLDSSTPDTPTQNPPPPYLWSLVYGEGLLAGPQDGSQPATVPAASAPLSGADKGAYGMQWWMYVKDWSYGYGQEKEVVVRSDPSNPGIYNPRVVLHPTDNTLKIYVSVFPSDNSSGTSEPAPSTSAGSTDDVFICEVPNIPLQRWFSVSVSVFTRNLDVYIDGKLVKSCFLSGVPKPAAGDIKINSNGGFAGLLCNFQHTSGMLNPSDAIAFYAKDTTCRSQTDASTLVSNATGYNVKFGVYDPTGKTVQEYSF